MANCPTCLYWKRRATTYGQCWHVGPWHRQLISETFGCEAHEPKVIHGSGTPGSPADDQSLPAAQTADPAGLPRG